MATTDKIPMVDRYHAYAWYIAQCDVETRVWFRGTDVGTQLAVVDLWKFFGAHMDTLDPEPVTVIMELEVCGDCALILANDDDSHLTAAQAEALRARMAFTLAALTRGAGPVVLGAAGYDDESYCGDGCCDLCGAAGFGEYWPASLLSR